MWGRSMSGLIVVSNRLPLNAEEHNGEVTLRPSGGGLVTALVPGLRGNGGDWVGWSGWDSDVDFTEALQQCAEANYSFEPVSLSKADKVAYYQGCCNQIIWPLFHGLPSRCDFAPAYWEAYCRVNDKFADAVEQIWQSGDFVWVHDFHLMLLADCLQTRGMRARTGYFHHIPFPHPEILEKLPWRERLLRAMLQFNTLGFQTVRDRDNFVAAVRQLLPEVHLEHLGSNVLLRSGSRCTFVGSYPISIDFEEFSGAAARAETLDAAAKIQLDLGPSSIVLGIDRLDYTKGILERLKSFENLLATHAELRSRVSLLQVVVPSREDIGEYQQLKLAIERHVSRINGQYATTGWLPVHYWYRNLSRPELVALYRAADIALVTPLKDGMNLVAKEFCACRNDETGVLILSEFAGAAAELRCGALMVNPYDIEAVASALHSALHMSALEQRTRMDRMRNTVRAHDVFHWSRSFFAQVNPIQLDTYLRISKPRLAPAPVLAAQG